MTNNTEALSPERQNFLKEAGKKRLANFCETVGRDWLAAWFHESIAQKLQEAVERLEQGISSRIIIEMPPRCGKSQLASILFPAWVLGRHPEWQIILASYSADLAVDFGQATRDIMQEGNYQLLFGTRLREDTKAKGKWMTKASGSYTAVGIGGSISGRGFKIGIIDDPFKNRQEADSMIIREGVWKWYLSTFRTRQEGSSIIIVINTRWHMDDLVGRLEEQETELEKNNKPHDAWEYLTFPAVAEEDEAYRRRGDPLWPEKFPLIELQKTQEELGVYEWAALYQQSPVLGETAEIRKEYFSYFEEREVDQKRFNINIFIDPAISKKKESANTAIVSIGKEDDRPEWYILDYIVGKLDPGQLIDGAFTQYKTYRRKYPMANIRVFVESVGYQKSLSYWFGEEMKRQQLYFDVEEVSTTGDKEQRIRGLIPMWKQGVIKHRRSMRELELEAVSFPKGRTVDILDAISFGIQVQENTERKREKKQQDYIPSSSLEGGDAPHFAMIQTDYPLRITEPKYRDMQKYQSSSVYEGE